MDLTLESSPVTDYSKSSLNDPLSSSFIHHSDNPGVVLVSQLLIRENCTSWSKAMKILLSVKNKFRFVDGSISRLEGNDLELIQS